MNAAPGPSQPSSFPRTGRSTVYAPHGVAAASEPLATGAALRVLEGGGTAADAVVAAAAVLNVTEPHMTGIGGDAFAIVWSESERRLVGLDASGRSGSRAAAGTLRDSGEQRAPDRGARSVTVPGALSGWQALLDRFGTLTLQDVLAPAIRIAEEGFPVAPVVARDWGDGVDTLGESEGARATYLADGRAPAPGDWVRNPDLAASLVRIARDGTATLYGGDLGGSIVEALDALGGYLTIEDLAAHEPRWVEPLSVDYGDYTLHELPPAGQGIAALQMLKMLEGLHVGALSHGSAEYLHVLIEAKKLAYADLARYVADPDEMAMGADRLLDPEYLAARARSIDPTRAALRTEPGRPLTESETVYLTVADRHGTMISFINSLCGPFGSGVVAPGTGILLQNRGAGFVLDPGHPNCLAPRRRPLHTIIPAFVTRDGEPLLSFGVMGGSMQPQGHVQVLLNVVEFGMDVQAAIDAPRFRHLEGASVAIEDVDPETARRLRDLGHDVIDATSTSFGGAQAILKLDRGWAAGSDPRKDGMAAGH